MTLRPSENSILAALPAAEHRYIEAAVHRRLVRRGQTLFEVGDVISEAYFPVTGVVSSLTVMDDGTSIEGLITGREGMVGAVAAWEATTTPWRIIAQSTLDTQVLPSAALRATLHAMPTMQRLLTRCLTTAQYQATQSIACNRFHPLPERAARWLLMVLDRIGGKELDLTQEFIANMLGVQRPSVSLALGVLQRAGLIARRRAAIIVLDRDALEQASCECYRRVEAELADVFNEG